jgi:hypothetical protein
VRPSRRRCQPVLAAAWLTGPFEDTITLSDGRTSSTLTDAGGFITSLPKAERQLEQWQTAIECLIGAAESRDHMMHARIGVLRALNRDVDRVQP